MNLKYIYVVALSAALLTSVGCEEEPEGLSEEKDKAKIIFINAAPNATIDAAKAGREIGIYPDYNGVQFNNFPIKFPWSNGYKAFQPGAIVMDFDTAWSQANNPPGPKARIGSVTIDTQADEYYSVYATGTVGDPTNMVPLVLNDDLSLPSAGKAKIRILNLSPDAGPVELVITAGGGITAPLVIAENLDFRTVKDFFEINPGRYTMQFRDAVTKANIGPAKADMIIDKASCYDIWCAGFRTMPAATTFSGYAFLIRYHANRWSNPNIN